MTCQKCGKNPASTHVKTIVNGKLSEFSLCAGCAAEMGYGNLMPSFSFNSFFKNLFDEPVAPAEKCPQCGMTLQDIMKLGRVGCSSCYHKFYESLLPSIQRIHGTAVHKGKAPGKSAMLAPALKSEMAVVQQETLEQKRLLLKNAIEEQRFEDAANLRDEIKEMEESGNA